MSTTERLEIEVEILRVIAKLQTMKPSRERALAITKLEEASFWAAKGTS